MKLGDHKKLLTSLVVLAAVGGGVIGFGREYLKGSGFQPFETDRELQNRQVFFPEGEVGSQSGTKDAGSDSFWEKDENGEEGSGGGTGSGYILSGEEQLALASQSSRTVAQQGAGETDSPTELPRGDIYEMADRESNTDLVLPGGGSGSGVSGGSHTGSDNGSDVSDNGGSGENDSQTEKPNTTPGGTGDNTGNVGGNSGTGTGENGGNGTGGNGSGGDNTGGSTDSGNGGDHSGGDNTNTGNDDEKPGPGDNLVKDPIPGNGKDSKDEVTLDPVPPSSIEDGNSQDFGQTKPGQFKDHDYQVYFSQPVTVNASGAERLYKGQKDVDQLTLFQSMDSYVWDADEECAYYWTAKDLDTGVDDGYDKYVKITGVSFDWDGEEEPLITEFPVEIPEDAEEVMIFLSYRLDPEDAWTPYTSTEVYWGEEEEVPGVAYDTLNSRILVLNKIVETKGEVIKKENILNVDRQYVDEDSTDLGLNLLEYQGALLGADNTGKMRGLFPGWKEDGVFVPFSYPTDVVGRHVLEPAALVPFDTEKYQINLRRHWMDKNYQVTDGGDTSASSYISLQAMTDYVGDDRVAMGSSDTGYDWLETLQVPQYVQSVEFDYGIGFSVDYLELPSSVLYVNTNGIPSIFDDWISYDRGLQVDKAYVVDEDNPRYTAVDGLLYNKEEMQILGVPVEVEELTVNSAIEKVVLPYQNQLKYMRLDIADIDQLPDINYERLNRRTCKIVVPDHILADYLEAEKSMLQRTRLQVVAESDLETTCTLEDSFLIAGDGHVRDILRNKTCWITLPDTVQSVAGTAISKFAKTNAYTKPLSVIVLPSSGNVVSFSEGSFDGYESMTIGCYTDEQEAAVRELAEQYPSCSFTIERVTVRQDGYAYVQTPDGVLLCGIPDGIEMFTGVIPGENGGASISVAVIGDLLFKDSYHIQWVLLPEGTVKGIGYGAFENCWNLEGILLDEREECVLGEDIVDECPALRFLAVNAKKLYAYEQTLSLTEQVEGETYSFLFAKGDVSSWTWTNVQAADHYVVQDCGATKVLYGADAAGTPLLALRSGKICEGGFQLPQTTTEIYAAAFGGLYDWENTAISFNWDALKDLRVIGAHAFAASMVGGDVTLPDNVEVQQGAFADCPYLTGITIPGQRGGDGTGGIRLGEQIFDGCSALTSIRLGDFRAGAGIYANAFDGCGITELILDDTQPPQLLTYESGKTFYFAKKQEQAGLLHLSVPEDCREQYISAWRCSLTGYVDADGQTGYEQLWDAVGWDLADRLDREPTDEEILAAVNRRLLRMENRLRTLMGMEPAADEEPDDETTLEAAETEEKPDETEVPGEMPEAGTEENAGEEDAVTDTNAGENADGTKDAADAEPAESQNPADEADRTGEEADASDPTEMPGTDENLSGETTQVPGDPATGDAQSDGASADQPDAAAAQKTGQLVQGEKVTMEEAVEEEIER